MGGDCGGETTAFIEVLAGGEASGGGEMEAALSSEKLSLPHALMVSVLSASCGSVTFTWFNFQYVFKLTERVRTCSESHQVYVCNF